MVNHCITSVFSFDPDLVIKGIQNVAQYFLHHVTFRPKKWKLLRPTVYDEMYLQENTLSEL